MSSVWPLFDLEIRHPQFVLRLPNDEQVEQIANLAARGIHGDEYLPFMTPWSLVPSPQLERNTMQFHWSNRAQWRPDDWQAAFAVVVDGQVVGIQSIVGKEFATLREVKTGSWLGREFQGQGIGFAMRGAMLDFAFGTLGAKLSRSAAHPKNVGSIKISERLGYVDDKSPMELRDGAPGDRQFLITRETWMTRDRADLESVEVVGFDSCTEFFGLGDTSSWKDAD